MESPSKKETVSRRTWRWWKEIWAFFGPVISLVAAWFLFKPNIEIAPNINLDPAQPLATQFWYVIMAVFQLVESLSIAP